MISTLIKDHLPEWIEVSTIVLTLIIGATTSAGVTLYRVSSIADDVSEIRHQIANVPVIMEQLKATKKDIIRLDTRLEDLRKHDLEIHHGKER